MRAAERWTQQRFRDWGLSQCPRRGLRVRPRLVDRLASEPDDGAASARAALDPRRLDAADQRHDQRRHHRRADRRGGGFRALARAIARQDRADQPPDAGLRAGHGRLPPPDRGGAQARTTPISSPIIRRWRSSARCERADFAERLDAFLAEEGALAWVRIALSRRRPRPRHRLFLPHRRARRACRASRWRRRIIAGSPAWPAPTPRRRSSSTTTSASTTRTAQAYNIIAEIPGHRPARRLCDGRRPSR